MGIVQTTSDTSACSCCLGLRCFIRNSHGPIGGHTTEMMRLLQPLKTTIPQMECTYLVAQTDTISHAKIGQLGTHDRVIRIPRSRQGKRRFLKRADETVGQSYFTSVFTTGVSVLYCIPVVFSEMPDMV